MSRSSTSSKSSPSARKDVQVVEAESVDSALLVELLSRGFNNPRITPAHWDGLLHYPWRRPGETSGYVLLDGEKPVGFLGTVYSMLQTESGRTQSACNLSSWLCLPDYKHGGAYLLKTALGDENAVITNLSADPVIIPTLRKLGFETLDDTLYMSTPAALLGNPFRGKVISQSQMATRNLDPRTRKIYQDHSGFPCRQVLLDTPEGECHVVYGLKPSRWGRYAYIHYVSNPQAFVKNAASFVRYCTYLHAAPRFAVESRLLSGLVPANVKKLPLVNKLYRPRLGVASRDVTNLYTEVTILGL